MLWKKKDKNFVDLTDYYKKQQARASEIKESLSSQEESSQEESQQANSGGMFGFFSAIGNSNKQEDSDYVNISDTANSYESSEEKRKRFAKRIADMTTQIENLSNQIYRLQQRLDVLERKSESEY